MTKEERIAKVQEMIDAPSCCADLKEAGCPAKVMVGGACLTQDYADQAGADAYAKDGVEAVKLAEKLIEK